MTGLANSFWMLFESV